MKKLSLLVIISSFALTACGGGGDSEGSKSVAAVVPTPAAYSFSLSQNEVVTNESTKVEISVTESGATSPSYTVESDNGIVKANVSSGKLVIDIGDVDRRSSAKIKVTGTQGPATKTVEVLLNITNTSAEEIVANISGFISAKPTFETLNEEAQVFEFLTDLAYVSGNITKSAANTMRNQYESAISESKSNLENVFDELSTTLSSYQSGSISDANLETEYDDAMALVNAHGKIALDQINIASSSLSVVSEIPVNGFAYNKSLTVFSQFIGNNNIGAVETDTWVFNSEYAYLGRLLPAVNGLGNVCAIDE